MKDVPYITLDDLKGDVGITEEHSFYYLSSRHEKTVLSCVEANDYEFPKEFQLEDDVNQQWDPKTNTAFLNLKVQIENPSILFGKKGLAYEDTRLGLGLEWKGEKAKVKRFRKIGEINCSDTPLLFEINDIEVKEITSNVTFSYVIYVIEPGKTGPRIPSFGNKKGLILGNKELLMIVCGGNASEFPISFENSPKEPLWRISFSASDLFDSFSDDNLCIIINKGHPSYLFMDENSESFNPLFLREVMESSVTALLLEIKHMDKSGYDLEGDDAVQSGSILQAIKYWAGNGISFKENVTDIEFHRSIQMIMGGIKYDKDN